MDLASIAIIISSIVGIVEATHILQRTVTSKCCGFEFRSETNVENE